MNEITIGRLGPDWKPSSVARYYAERGNDGDYAFGSTPVEALVRLEAREAAAKSKFDGDLAEEIAFLALGADEFLKEHRSTNLGSCGGYMGFIAEVIRHAPMLAEYSKHAVEDGFGGVWLYDVTQRFGREWAREVSAGSDESPEGRLECIIADEMEKWS